MRENTHHGEHGDQRRYRARTSSQRGSRDGLSCLQRTWWSGWGTGRRESGATIYVAATHPTPRSLLYRYRHYSINAQQPRPDRSAHTALDRQLTCCGLGEGVLRSNCSHHSFTASGADDRLSGFNLFRHYSPGHRSSITDVDLLRSNLLIEHMYSMVPPQQSHNRHSRPCAHDDRSSNVGFQART